MEKTSKIVRISIHTFFLNYQYLTSIAAVLALPFSLSVLLSQSFIPSPTSSLQRLLSRLQTLLTYAGIPSSGFLDSFNLKISQTISSYVFTLPFNLTFLLIAKAAAIQELNHDKRSLLRPSFSSLISIYNSLLTTYVCKILLILYVNVTAFALFFLASICFEGFGFDPSNSIIFLPAVGTVLYSIILASFLMICNLALVLSGMERCGGYMPILKACVLMRGRATMALSLALPIHFSFAACEALFHYRIFRAYHVSRVPSSSIAFEGLFIAYLYSILVVLDTIISCFFLKSCKKSRGQNQKSLSYGIDIMQDDNSCTTLKDMVYMVEESGSKESCWRLVIA